MVLYYYSVRAPCLRKRETDKIELWKTLSGCYVQEDRERTQREFLLGIAAFLHQSKLIKGNRERKGPASLPADHLCPLFPSTFWFTIQSNQSSLYTHLTCVYYTLSITWEIIEFVICNVRLLVIIDVGSWAPPRKLPATSAQNVRGCLAWHVPVFVSCCCCCKEKGMMRVTGLWDYVTHHVIKIWSEVVRNKMT
jgi:hypothetical protein